MDDIAVKMPKESPEWLHIVATKGLDECMRRKAFLGDESSKDHTEE